jgi:hypothetical protein
VFGFSFRTGNARDYISNSYMLSGITGEGPDWPSLRRGIAQARDDGATVIWCHNTFGHEDVPDWLAGLLHAHSIFEGGTHGSYYTKTLSIATSTSD